MLFVQLVQANLTTRRLGREITYYPFTDSTNADLWELQADGEAVPGQVVVTDHQKAGRGRQGRTWFSAPDLSLPFSVLIQPQHPAERLGLLSLAAGVAVVDALAGVQVAAKLKWPNDIVVGPDKLGGILAEGRTIKGQQMVVLGMGLNVNEQPADFPKELQAVSSARIIAGGPPVQRELLLAGVLNRLEHLVEAGLDDVAGLWQERCAHLDAEVRFHGASGPVQGRFLGIDASGRGTIDVDGQVITVLAGDLDWSPA